MLHACCFSSWHISVSIITRHDARQPKQLMILQEWPWPTSPGRRNFTVLIKVSQHEVLPRKESMINTVPAPDQQGVCMLVNMYILIASWVNPAFRESAAALAYFAVFADLLRVLTYAAFLIIMVLRSPLPLDAEPTPEDDLEKAKGRASTLPLQGVGDSGAAPTSEIRDSSQRLKDLLNAVFPDSPATAERDSTSPMRSDNRKSASSIKRDRLSKPLPASYFYNQ